MLCLQYGKSISYQNNDSRNCFNESCRSADDQRDPGPGCDEHGKVDRAWIPSEGPMDHIANESGDNKREDELHGP